MGSFRKRIWRVMDWASHQPLLQWLKPPWRAGKFVAGGAMMYVWLRHVCRRRIPAQATAAEAPLVVILACSHLPSDARVQQHARVLAAHGFRVKVICPEWWPATVLPSWGAGTAVRALPRQATAGRDESPWTYSMALLQAAREEQAWAYHACGLPTVVPALLAAASRRVTCLCDLHAAHCAARGEAASGSSQDPHPLIRRWVSHLLERVAVHSATAVLTDSEESARRLRRGRRSRRPLQVLGPGSRGCEELIVLYHRLSGRALPTSTGAAESPACAKAA
jgi:hypothetical protein